MVAPRIRELDGLRGIAILMVLLWHFVCIPARYINPDLSPWINALFEVTWSGVDLFFVLSGFLIGGQILDRHQRPGFLSSFWLKRAGRILPPLLVLMAAFGISQWVVDAARFPWLYRDSAPWWSVVTFTQNLWMAAKGTFGGNFINATWSLAIEEQFYLFAPLAIMGTPKRWWIWITPALILLPATLRLGLPGYHVMLATPFRMDCILVGFAIAGLHRNANAWATLRRLRGWLAALVFMLGWAGLAIVQSRFYASSQFTYAALYYGLLLATTMLWRETHLTAPLRSSSLAFYGAISYGLYLYHMPISGLLHYTLNHGEEPNLLTKDAMLIMLAAFVVSTLLAWISRRTLERRVIDWTHRRARSISPDAVTAKAAAATKLAIPA